MVTGRIIWGGPELALQPGELAAFRRGRLHLGDHLRRRTWARIEAGLGPQPRRLSSWQVALPVGLAGGAAVATLVALRGANDAGQFSAAEPTPGPGNVAAAASRWFRLGDGLEVLAAEGALGAVLDPGGTLTLASGEFKLDAARPAELLAGGWGVTVPHYATATFRVSKEGLLVTVERGELLVAASDGAVVVNRSNSPVWVPARAAVEPNTTPAPAAETGGEPTAPRSLLGEDDASIGPSAGQAGHGGRQPAVADGTGTGGGGIPQGRGLALGASEPGATGGGAETPASDGPPAPPGGPPGTETEIVTVGENSGSGNSPGNAYGQGPQSAHGNGPQSASGNGPQAEPGNGNREADAPESGGGPPQEPGPIARGDGKGPDSRSGAGTGAAPSGQTGGGQGNSAGAGRAEAAPPGDAGSASPPGDPPGNGPAPGNSGGNGNSTGERGKPPHAGGRR